MQRISVFIAALIGLSSVALGAYFQHASVLNSDAKIAIHTALRYLQMYSLLLLVLGFLSQQYSRLLWAYAVFLVGVSLFSGSILLIHSFGMSSLVLVTPLGGVIVMLGWVVLMSLAIVGFGDQKQSP